jgi:protein TonB
MAACAAIVGRGVRALPLPRTVRRWLWLEPPKLRDDGRDYAQLAVKRQYGVVLPFSMMAAVAVHAGVFVFSPTFEIEDMAAPAEELHAVALPPDIEVPPPPPAIARPAAPIIETDRIAEDITIVPPTFEPVAELAVPPPPPVVAEEVVDTVPAFTPYTVAPRIVNVEELQELMAEEYPTLLRRSGIGGRVGIRALVDTDGEVERVVVIVSSGHESLDQAAVRVGMRIRCSPALNRDVVVRAWISTAVEFAVR